MPPLVLFRPRLRGPGDWHWGTGPPPLAGEPDCTN